MTTKTLTAIIIDPAEMTVSKAEIGAGLDPIYEAIGNGCQNFDIVRIGDGIDMFVDDEGFRENEQDRFFSFTGSDSPTAGRGVILGHDGKGETISVPDWLTPELVSSKVRWIGSDKNLERLIELGIMVRPHVSITSWGADGATTTETIWQWNR